MKSRNKKEVINNLLAIGTQDILTLLIPIVTMPILTRALGIELYGQYLLFMAVIVFGHTIVNYGVQYTGVRIISSNLDDRWFIRKEYSEFQGMRFILLLIYIAVLSIYVSFFPTYLLNIKNLLLYIVPYLIGYILIGEWFLQGIAQTKLLLYISLFSKLVNLFVILFIVKEESDFFIAIISSTWNVFAAGIITFVLMKIKYNLVLCSFNNVKKKFSEGRDVFIGLLAPNLYNSIPLIIVGGFANQRDFSEYALASRVCSIIYIFQEVLSKSLFPVLSRLKNKKLNLLFLVNNSVSISSFFFMVFFGSDVIELFLGVKFDSEFYIIILSFSLIFSGLSSAISKGYFLPNGYDNIYKKISIRVSVLSALISVALIYFYGVKGCAMGVFIARFLFFCDYYYAYKTLGCSEGVVK
ncbi:oligosaccharide flippase family protein [Pseudoalteromonas rhizosphaerae]|uniref:oligosaccharide flippase family protein n=1 Tax=Pseudoalteromonas rhizosphaerae TaxID=2518973 RepID=UPI0037041205